MRVLLIFAERCGVMKFSKIVKDFLIKDKAVMTYILVISFDVVIRDKTLYNK